MSTTFHPTTPEIRDLFAEEVAAAGGSVSDVYDDGVRLLARSILPSVREVRPNDRVQGGVALRVGRQEIQVHPYVFRQVCKNGAIVAQALQTRRLDRVEDCTPEAVLAVTVDLRAALRACCAADAFAESTERMRSAAEAEADLALHLLPLLARMPAEFAVEFFPQIVERFEGERDRSAFGLMNAVTSLARDTRNPEARWRLEELGGEVPALVTASARRPVRAREMAAALRA